MTQRLVYLQSADRSACDKCCSCGPAVFFKRSNGSGWMLCRKCSKWAIRTLGTFVSWPTLTDEGGLRGGWVVMDRIEEILKLAREGFRVFPLKPGTKIPA